MSISIFGRVPNWTQTGKKHGSEGRRRHRPKKETCQTDAFLENMGRKRRGGGGREYIQGFFFSSWLARLLAAPKLPSSGTLKTRGQKTHKKTHRVFFFTKKVSTLWYMRNYYPFAVFLHAVFFPFRLRRRQLFLRYFIFSWMRGNFRAYLTCNFPPLFAGARLSKKLYPKASGGGEGIRATHFVLPYGIHIHKCKGKLRSSCTWPLLRPFHIAVFPSFSNLEKIYTMWGDVVTIPPPPSNKRR